MTASQSHSSYPWYRIKVLVLCHLLLGFYLIISLKAVRATQDPTIQESTNIATSQRSPTQTGVTHEFNIMWQSTGIETNGGVTVGDFNGDGLLDIASHDYHGENNSTDEHDLIIYINRGDRTFSITRGITNATLPSASYRIETIYEGDVDGDGDLDLVTYNSALNQSHLHVNDGNGIFTPQYAGDLTEYGRGGINPAWGDVDGDGDLDIFSTYEPSLFSAESRQLKILINNGLGIFTDNTPSNLTTYSNIYGHTWGDVNQDGLIDLIFSSNTANKVYLNQGNLVFTEIHGGDFFTESIPSGDLQLGDMDMDGDLDLVLAYSLQDTVISNQVYENNGYGVFTNVTASDLAADAIRTSHDIAWGDVDSDGDLDLAVANYSNPNLHQTESSQIYRNDGNGVFTDISAGDLFNVTRNAKNVSWGDMDNDGDLDLVIASFEHDIIIYENRLGYTFSTPLTLTKSSLANPTTQISWGDIDNDQDLDIVMAGNQTATIISNLGAGGFTETLTLSAASVDACGLTLGDSDGDNDLEIVLGNSTNSLYLNLGITATTFFSQTNAGSFSAASPTCQLTWGDADNDQDLDLLGIQNGTAVLYRNDGNNQFSLATTLDNGGATITTAAWADIDNDSDLDIFVGSGTANRVYRHDGMWSFTDTTAGDLLTDSNDPQTAVWGDIDGDSDLDLFIGNQTTGPNLYRNDGSGLFTHLTSSELANEIGIVTDSSIGDIDGDSDLDLLIGFHNQPAKLYRNDGNGNFDDVTSGQLASDLHISPQVALGDGDGDGDLDALIGTPGYVRLYFNQQHIRMPTAQNIHQVGMYIHPPNHIPAVYDYGTADLVTDITVPIPYTVWATDERHIAEIEAWYSPNNGGNWYPAIAATGTPTQNIQAGIWPTGTNHIFYWDTFASNFSGQSNHTLIRLVAKPHGQTTGHNFTYPNQAYFPQTHGSSSATSTPFRILTTHIQVFSQTAVLENQLANAVVYQRTQHANIAQPIGNQNGITYQTNNAGYLTSHSNLAIGDELFAMSLISQSGALDFYHMNSTPDLTGLDGHTITQAGKQALVVSAGNPLIVANLDISLEWDARQDVVFLAQLERDLKHAAELLFDVTDGQLTLGDINIYHNKENWEESHIVIYTNNNMRPNVDLGGITTEPVSATLATGEVIPNGYLPGQVRMPREWNRFGNEGSTFGNDWALALAHELVHYILFIPDNYLGIDHEGRLIQIDCAGSVMTNAYLATYSELLPASTWNNDAVCLSSVAELTTGRSDWETVQHFYPQLNLGGSNAGPYKQPLNLTNVAFIEPASTTNTVIAPTYFVKNELGQAVSLPTTQVNVYRRTTQGTANISDDRLIRLGTTRGDIIDATGIEIGDLLCVHDNSQDIPRRGCIEINETSTSLTIYETPSWAPEIDVDLVSSRTVRITVTQAALSNDLYAQIYPDYPRPDQSDIEAPYAQLAPVPHKSGVYTAEITAIFPFFSGDVRLWVDGSTEEEFSNFFFGGGWGTEQYGWGTEQYGWGTEQYGWGTEQYGWGTEQYGWGPNRQGWTTGRIGWNSPILSGDGQVILFDIDNMFGTTPPYSIQQLPNTADLSSWLTPIGQGYRISTPSQFTGTRTIMINYMQRSVPSLARESDLKIYYRPEGDNDWQVLDTAINTTRNLASALMVNRGDYVLATTVTYPTLYAGEWNLFGYSIYNTRPVSEALASINGSYQTVLWYDPSDQLWDIYDTTIKWPLSELVNTLTQFEHGQGYWIFATETVTPSLGISVEPPSRQSLTESPPMVAYGWITESNHLNLAPGMTIEAHIAGQVCGTSQIEYINGRFAYTMQIPALQSGSCATTDATITFTIDGQDTAQSHKWSNKGAQFLPIRATGNQTMTNFILIPLMQR